MLPLELTVPVQVVFASSTAEGVLLDCTVAEEVRCGGPVRIAPGSPFSLLIGHLDADLESGVAAMRLLEDWCADGVVVQATTSASSRWMVLRHDRDQLLLEIS